MLFYEFFLYAPLSPPPIAHSIAHTLRLGPERRILLTSASSTVLVNVSLDNYKNPTSQYPYFIQGPSVALSIAGRFGIVWHEI